MRRRVISHSRAFVADSLTPVDVYRRLARLSPVRFLFESVTGGEQVSRYSFLGAGPREIYRVLPEGVEVCGGDAKPELLEGPPLEVLRRVLAGFDPEPTELPFAGGFVGWFGFDLARLVERLPDAPPDPYGGRLPLAWLGRFDRLVVFDHARQRILAIANEIEGEVDRRQAEQRLDELSGLLTRDRAGAALAMPSANQSPAELSEKVSLEPEAYRAAVRVAKSYIEAGDVFQVVLARRWSLAATSPVGETLQPISLYRALRLVNPSPYMVLLETPEAALVGASPEMLVRKQGDRIETRPIAGTRPRGSDGEHDRRLAVELAADQKERAEHLMLVDLGRNDLGRVSASGSVRVASFMEVERYSHVMHLESSVEGRLAENRDALDALLACFPAGTLSGAPKIRAMELISELEPESRGPYGGAVGYLSYGGDMDTCITIRTLVVADGEVSVSAGAGIVADSVPEAEERETRNKAAALMAAVTLASQLESA